MNKTNKIIVNAFGFILMAALVFATVTYDKFTISDKSADIIDSRATAVGVTGKEYAQSFFEQSIIDNEENIIEERVNSNYFLCIEDDDCRAALDNWLTANIGNYIEMD